MTRDEFCKYHWDYYLALENDFLLTERYVSFDLGENYLYNDDCKGDKGNSECFSNEYVKQYQAICSEVDVLLKTICKEFEESSKAENMRSYTEEILKQWPTITSQEVEVKDKRLVPFGQWEKGENYKSPAWWGLYNDVKHNRIVNYRQANLKNVINALAGLYVLEQYLVKYIGDRDGEKDVPNDVSKIFKMRAWSTRETVVGKECYEMTSKELDSIYNEVFSEKSV